MFSKYRKVLLLFGTLAFIALILGYYFLYAPNVKIEKYELKIKPNTSLDALVEQLEKDNVISNASTFRQVASLMKYGIKEIPTGRYILKSGMSNRKLISKLRAKDQDHVNLTFNNVWNIQELSGKLSKDLLADSLSLLNAFLSSANLSKHHLTPETVLTTFIPNTYDIFWDIAPEKLLDRMVSERDKFWNKERLSKANAINLSATQVYTLASIVERESNNKSERPTVAGVYLNRLRIGDKLRADPTVVFANGDFTLRRVLIKHLEMDSPYNTYMYSGLPPGPIFMPSENSIDAVLNAEKHEYFFFCAKPGYDSKHAFAKTAEQHSVNASIYHKWLSSEGIK